MERIHKMKKVALFFGSLKKGGTENTICNIANTMIRNGYIVHIIVLNGDAIEYSLDSSVNVINLSTESTSILSRILNLRRLLNNEKYDTIAAFSSKILLYLFFACPIKKFRLVGFERSNPYMAVDGLKGKLIKKVLSNWADGYVFQTEGAKSFYSKGVQKKSVIIQNGLLGDIVNKPIITFNKRNQQKVVSVGRLQPGKGLDCAIKAFYDFCKELDGYSYHIFGEGPERHNLEMLIKELGLEGKVFLEGKVDDVYESISDAACFIFTSRHEGMPNSLLEAMACGLPCIATDCRFGPCEIINDGVNGLLVAVDDVKGISDSLKRVLNDPAFAKSLSKEAEKVRITNNWESISKRYIDFIING